MGNESAIKVKWPRVLYGLEEPLIAWIDLGNATMFRIISFTTYSPKPAIFIGIERIGCYLFPRDKPIAWEYICNKIPVPEADARPIADWMNAQLDFDYPQQGEYWMKYLTPSEPYPYAGEMAASPLCPEVING